MGSIENLHNKLLTLLTDLDTICSNHNIKYSLFAGTAIGTIRHKGFIPWDDDADIVFERSEYDKFLKVIPANFAISSNELWVTRFISKDNPKICIDLFVFDNTSNFKVFQKLHVFGLKAIQGTLKRQITKDKGVFGFVFTAILYVIGRLFSKNFKLKIYNKFAIIYKNKDSNYMFSSLDKFAYIGKILPKTILSSYSKIDFEGVELMIMDGYHPYLTKFYGDYMKLPPAEEQIPEHGNLEFVN